MSLSICLALSVLELVCSFFFFQAEDGIRDADVTGVQTCALPICFRRAVRFIPPGSCCTAPRGGSREPPRAGGRRRKGHPRGAATGARVRTDRGADVPVGGGGAAALRRVPAAPRLPAWEDAGEGRPRNAAQPP